MIGLLEELVDLATVRAMVSAALTWPLELLEDLYTSARSRVEHACWIHGFVGFGGGAP